MIDSLSDRSFFTPFLFFSFFVAGCGKVGDMSPAPLRTAHRVTSDQPGLI